MTRGPAVVTIRLAAIRANYATALRAAAGRRILAVVKADAYGHGAVPVARTLVDAGCRHLAVTTVDEAVLLRDAGLDVPILVLGGVRVRADADESVARGLTPVVHHAGERQLLSDAAHAAGAVLPVHVEVDSGMRRMGFPPEEASGSIAAVAGEPHLSLAGVYSHFARADEADLTPCLEQIARFRRVLDALRERGVTPGLVHMANSAGLLSGRELTDALPEEAAVRPGLMLYGVQPSACRSAHLEPAMTVRCRVVQLRRARAGDAVGYGATHRFERDTTVATLDIGYADGVPVASSNCGRVVVRGRFLPIVGRVSMDTLTADAGDGPVEIGDEAVVFGGGPTGDRLPVEEVAAAAGTIAYELLVRVGPRVLRVVED